MALSILYGSGSLSEGEFTAPSMPITTALRAICSANNNQADLSVVVPPVITNTSGYRAVAPGEQIDFETNIPDLPYFVSVGTAAEGTGNVIPGLPPGLAEKDIMLLPVESANEVVPTPAGWAATADSPQGTGTGGGTTSTRLTMLWKRATASESPPTITDPGDHVIGQILAYRNCIDTGDPADVTAGDTGASSTSVSIPGATTTVPNTLVVQAVAHATDTPTPQLSGPANAALANLTERTDVATSQGNGGGFAVIDGQKVSAGAFGATAATLANASVQGRISVALKPAAKTWSASLGSINSGTGVWTAPGKPGQTARITVTNGAITARLEIDVLEKFPRSDFILPWPVDLLKRVLVSEAEDGTRTSRIKSEARRSFPVNLLVDTVADLNGLAGLDTIRKFWDRHHPGVRFILDDPEEGIRLVVYSDSDLRWEHTAAGIEIAFRVKEA